MIYSSTVMLNILFVPTIPRREEDLQVLLKNMYRHFNNGHELTGLTLFAVIGCRQGSYP